MSNICDKHLSVLNYGTVSARPKYYLVGAVSRFLSPEPSNINNDPVQESKSDNQNDSGGVREDQSDMGACQLNKSLPPRTGTKDQLKIEPQPEGYEKEEDNLPETGINSTDINKEDVQIHTSEVNTVDLKHTSNGESDAIMAKVEADDNCMAEVEVKASQEIGKAFKNPPLSVCEPACEEQPPEHNNEASPDGNKTQGFLETEEMQTHRQLREEVENLGNTTLAEQKLNALKDDMEDLQEIDLERTLRLCDASGGDNETRKETAGFPHEKLHTDQVIFDTSSSDESFDPEQDELANESMDRRNDTESFSVISSPELDFSDYSFGESALTWEAAKALERADDGDVLKSNASETRKMESEEELLTKILQSSDKAEKPISEAEVGSFALNFAPQRSRIAAKNPRTRPPKDRRSLLLRPSVDPEPPEIPKSKIPAGVHVLGGLGFGLKLPGFGSGLPVVQKEVELKPVPETDATKRAEVPHKPKWMPPRQAGFGNPFISELKTKLKKATKN
ncbi:uncharacterized protein si:ch211-136m16.8 isoform X2 [Syngnathus scovelli]|uniref:uncharacterized protein si:ch211-136m16.8 isoform X2 n=1 Tax=Syngnathus scovelli TaxID=161590 RepID=UPI00210F63B2|nr:uncharacterized protein si:ch211-136m16.8 isoform X2 [Syngnathus scovelli]